MNFWKLKCPFFLLERVKQSFYCHSCLEFIFQSSLCIPPVCHWYILYYVPFIIFAPTIVSGWFWRTLDTREQLCRSELMSALKESLIIWLNGLYGGHTVCWWQNQEWNLGILTICLVFCPQMILPILTT